MATDRSRKALIEFLDYLADKGLMAKATAAARKAAANKILGVLSEDEASDILSVDVDHVVMRFQNLEGKKYTTGSLNTYRSRLRSAIEDFESYLNNPLAFRPSLQKREGAKTGGTKIASNAVSKGGETVSRAVAAPQPVSSSIIPIPVRADLTVHVQGLPYDLTPSEARKIANIILAMAASDA